MISTRYELITPDIARHYLTMNTSNRPIRPSTVKSLSKAIERGEWIVTHQGIAFSKNGRLLDGQHRLKAIVEANIPVVMAVTNGLDDESFMVVDRHQRRSTADSLGLNRRVLEPIHTIATIARGVTQHTPQQIKSFVDIFYSISEELHSFAPSNLKVFTTAPVRAAAIFRALQRPLEMEFIFNSYRRISLRQIEDFTNIETVFYKKVLNIPSGSSTDQKMMFAFANICFTSENKRLSLIRVLDGGDKIASELREFCETKNCFVRNN